MNELEQLLAEAEPLRISDPEDKLGALVDRINAIRNGAPMAPAAVIEGADAIPPDDEPVSEQDEREALYEAAKQRGIRIDKRWSTDRLLEALA